VRRGDGDKELFADTLPTYLTRFVGRDWEIATVLSMLHPGRLAFGSRWADQRGDRRAALC
jgi:hypothetical protein